MDILREINEAGERGINYWRLFDRHFRRDAIGRPSKKDRAILDKIIENGGIDQENGVLYPAGTLARRYAAEAAAKERVTRKERELAENAAAYDLAATKLRDAGISVPPGTEARLDFFDGGGFSAVIGRHRVSVFPGFADKIVELPDAKTYPPDVLEIEARQKTAQRAYEKHRTPELKATMVAVQREFEAARRAV